MRRARGFTLIEILVALAILAVALAAAVRSASIATDATLDLRGGEAVLRHPQRERARLQCRCGVGGLRERTHAGRERDREDRERDQDLDEREAARCPMFQPAPRRGRSPAPIRRPGSAA